jgi:uncharacterized membrane protein
LKFGTKTTIVLAIVAALLSFVKFNHCRTYGWGQPDEYVHACYSDITSLFDSRGMNTHQWPYSSATNSVEYPPITGVVMWATAAWVGDYKHIYRNYFDLNAIPITLLFIGSVYLLSRARPKRWLYFAFAPAVLASLYINWDIWAVISSIGAIYLFEKKRYSWSAFALGISIATKFFPIVFLLPVALYFWQKREVKKAITYALMTVGSWLAINLPFILSTPQGWARFFTMNSARGADWGSLWIALRILGDDLQHVNSDWIVLFLAAIFAYSIYILRSKVEINFALGCFVVLAIFTSVGKVYSPQYVVLLTPLAIMALSKKERSAELIGFWIWQCAELMYHFAIWQYFAGIMGAKFGLPESWYAVACLLRIAGVAAFIYTLMRKSTAPSSPQLDQFPTPAVSG